MVLRVTFVLICAGLTGVQSLRTVEHVSVEVGDTVHIPCQYEEEYREYVKYLCRGDAFRSCSYEIKTNEANSAKYSISDDEKQRIVTFTLKNLDFKDSGYYWCAIEETGRDERKPFRLSVSEKGRSRLQVDSQWITGYFGDQVTINCIYNGSESNQWCRFGGPCVHSSERIDGALVTTDTNVPGLFAVTMSGLWERNSGWYWCSCGDLQMPVFLNVTVEPTIATIATTTASSTMEETNEDRKSVSEYLIAAAIALCFVVFIAVMSLIIWHRLKRNMKKTEEALSSPESEPVYSNVWRGPTSHQNPRSDDGTDILYTTVSFLNNPASEKTRVKEEDVVYSTVVL